MQVSSVSFGELAPGSLAMMGVLDSETVPCFGSQCRYKPTLTEQ